MDLNEAIVHAEVRKLKIPKDKSLQNHEEDIFIMLLNSAKDHLKAIYLLQEVVNSDMAQREEDEGNVSPLLTKIREFLA